MKRNYLLTACILLAVTATSCKKNNTDPGDLLGTGSMSMKVDGVQHEAGSAFVFTAHEPEENVYLVGISGFFTDDGFTDDDIGDAFHIYLAMTAAQFNNPKGTYDVIAEGSDIVGQPVVYGLYQVGIGTEVGNTYGVIDTDKTVGQLTITAHTIGNQTGILGLSGRGYTNLQGTFHMKLTGVRNDGSGAVDMVTITDGRFNVKNGLGFGF